MKNQKQNSLKIPFFLVTFTSFLFISGPGNSQPASSSLFMVVNSNQDGPPVADENLTLREAIAIANGTLPIEKLSQAESNQVILTNTGNSQIVFELHPEQTTIELVDILPPITAPGLTIDGTTQPGYNRENQTEELLIPQPIVGITPSPNASIMRGLTVMANDVTIRGLSLWGFTSIKYLGEDNQESESPSLPNRNIDLQGRWKSTFNLAADIFIGGHWSLVECTRLMVDCPQSINHNTPTTVNELTINNVVIEDNWIGIPPDGKMPTQKSAFGVWVFDGTNTTIQRNLIAHHDGSGILTTVQAENLKIQQNRIEANGLAGMPDAIRLEGQITNSLLTENIIRDNGGAGIFLFKPLGAVQILNNQIQSNGRRLQRAAIYLMGSGNEVKNNEISGQPGPGVVVSANPKSDRNFIQGNRFADLEGLSIDLNTQQNTNINYFQVGDGPNPPRNSESRRLDTGNSAINAPVFLANEFLMIDGTVHIDGIADPGSQIEIYQVSSFVSEETQIPQPFSYGPLNDLLGTVEADPQGRFSVTLSNLQPGEVVSAIATHPNYGTSEPARNAVVRSISGTESTRNPFKSFKN